MISKIGRQKGNVENFKLILPQHLNQYGYLFGGNLLQWADETAWIAASLDYPGCTFVTIGMDKVEFKKSVKEGAVLRIHVEKSREGNTSVQYAVNIFSWLSEAGKEVPVFTTNITFVRVDEQGRKKSLVSS